MIGGTLHVKHFRARIRKLPLPRMSEPDQDEMRRKRLARLSAPGGGGEKSKQVQILIYTVCPGSSDPT